MGLYRVYATYQTVVYADIEADSSLDAYEIARDMDGGDFEECDLGDWHVEANPELIEED